MITVEHAIVIILGAALVSDKIAENATASQQLATTKTKVTMMNTETDPDQEHNHDQGPVLVILKPQDTIMVTIFMIMTPGEGIGSAETPLSLV